MVPSIVPEGVSEMYSVPDNLPPDCVSEALPPPRGAIP